MAALSWSPVIRPALFTDIDTIAAVQQASILGLAADAYGAEGAAAWAEESLRHAPTLLQSGTYFVAEEAGLVVAVGGWSPHDQRSEAAWIRSLFVHPDAAGRGLGRRLMATAEASARAAGRSAFVVRASLNAVGFYQAMGYAEVERLRWRVASGAEMPSVLMAKAAVGA